MKGNLTILLLLFTNLIAYCANATISRTKSSVAFSNNYIVKIRTSDGKWTEIPTYMFNVDKTDNNKHQIVKTSVAKFDLEGTVEVSVTSSKEPIQTYRLRPLSYEIPSRQDGNTVIFTLNQPRYLSFEVNGDIYHNLQIFADSKIAKPKTKRKDLIYFGPGLHDLKGDSLAIPSGKTVFIDEGAIIKGWLSVYKANHVKIIGHGMITPGHHEGIMVRYSKDIVIDGPLTTQIPVGGSDSVLIRNAKVISWYGWGDGMNVFASNHVDYDNVFCRTSDDCSTVYCTRLGYHGGCRNIIVRNAVYWADVAHPIMIGLHGDINKNEVIENVLYDNIDILEQNENQIDYQGCIGINNGDNNLVRNITFSNIRVEDIHKGMLINMRVCYNKKYCHAPGRGIEDITFKNFSYNGTNAAMSIIAGYDDERMIRNIRFENFSINGKTIYDNMPDKLKWYKTTDYADIFVGEHVEKISFVKSMAPLDSVITLWMKKDYYPGGAIAVAKGDEVLFSKCYGGFTPDTQVFVA